MNLDTFFEKFDLFADAPNAVAKMRELILHLAMRGKLVPQNADDESVFVLIDRIIKKKKLLSSEPASSAKLSPSASTQELDIPKNWAAIGATAPARMVSDHGRKIQTKEILESGKYPVVDQGKVFIRGYCNDPTKVINAKEPIIVFGDHTRETKFITFDFVVGADGVKLLQPIEIDARYYFWALRWIPLESRGYGRHFKLLRESNIPLPPLAEQKRIVAKVDELMALCDRLEAQQQERETRHTALAQASLTRFADAPTPANLELLFHKSYSIELAELRKSILTLAVQGKLVPQDPNDEPAESILRETDQFFQRMVAEKRISAPKPLPPIDADQSLFALPQGWCWCRLGNLIRISSGDGLTAKQMNDGEFEVYGGNGVTGHHDQYNVDKPTLVIGRVGFYCGSIHITPKFAWVTDNAFISTFNEEKMSIQFLYWLLTATDLRARDNATAQPVISGGKIYPIVLGIPPLPEQKRIVAKVEQLMALVDRLEALLSESRERAARLMDAVVAEIARAA